MRSGSNRLPGAALALSLAVALVGPAQAAPASRASLEALFQLQHLDSLFDSVNATLRKSVQDMFAQDASKSALSPARRRIQAQALSDTMALVQGEYNWAALEPKMLDAFQKTFTEEEVTAMINSYATPAGQAAITKTPQLMQAVMADTQARMQSLMPRIQAIAEKARVDAAAADAADAAR